MGDGTSEISVLGLAGVLRAVAALGTWRQPALARAHGAGLGGDAGVATRGGTLGLGEGDPPGAAQRAVGTEDVRAADAAGYPLAEDQAGGQAAGDGRARTMLVKPSSIWSDIAAYMPR